MRIEELTAKALDRGDLDRYQLAMAVAKRAKELQDGAQSKLNVDLKTMKAADLALMEIAEGLVRVSGFVDKE
ncbi:MAG: DNA-directed RNA polymerase subunit omega [Helicobacteraceae bacterium 4484_230]|jgi:DNA-directed RNA polymerase subunit omega|nr:MAG: DNA-directed RNA polymerase subunit omega [Helicobacteraceae bacterium 4484_230]